MMMMICLCLEFRVLQIKCRLHESQMRERDVRVSIDRLFRGGEMTRSLFVQTNKCKSNDRNRSANPIGWLNKKRRNSTVSTVFCLNKKRKNSTGCFYCFCLTYDNRDSACCSWKWSTGIFHCWSKMLLLMLISIQWRVNWILSNGVEIDFVTPSLGIASDLKSRWTRIMRRVWFFRADVVRSGSAVRCW